MNEHNFNSFKNIEIPKRWVEGALNVPPEKEKTPKHFNKVLAIAACFTLVVAICCVAFLFTNADKTTVKASQPQTNSEAATAQSPDLSPAKTDLFNEQIPTFDGSTPQSTATDNICVGEFSSDLVLDENNIYCVIYDYKTKEPLGDENLFSDEHKAEITYNDNGMVTATYNPVEAGVVEKTGEYWYVFYNELAISPVQNYIFIYI